MGGEVAVCKFEMKPFVFPAFSICIAQEAVVVSQLWTLAMKMPRLRAGSVDALRGVSRYSIHETVGDGIDKSRGQMICTAGSSTKWGLFWLMNIELLLSNSKLYPALQMSIFVRG